MREEATRTATSLQDREARCFVFLRDIWSYRVFVVFVNLFFCFFENAVTDDVQRLKNPMAAKLSQSSIARLHSLFKEFDRGTGVISVQDVPTILRLFGQNPSKQELKVHSATSLLLCGIPAHLLPLGSPQYH